MKKLSFILLFVSLSACMSELDFDQADSLHITPVFDADMFYIDIHNDNLVDAHSNFRSVIQDTVKFGLFEDGKIRDGFVKAEITVGYNNSFQRVFDAQYFFIDGNDQPVSQGNFTIGSAAQGSNVTGEQVFVFEKATNPNFVNFRKIVVKVIVSPESLPVEDEHLHIQTKGKFYIETDLN